MLGKDEDLRYIALVHRTMVGEAFWAWRDTLVNICAAEQRGLASEGWRQSCTNDD